MAKPVCSNCQLYKVRCTTTLIRRRAMAPKLKPPADMPPPEREPRPNHTANDNGSLEARLKGIEARLDSLGASSGGDASLTSLLGYPPVINTHDFGPNMDMSMLETPGDSEPVVVGNGGSSSNNSSSHASPAGDSFFPELPPLHEALPVIECYFQDFNSILPLHHQHTFMRLLHRCYSRGGGVEQQQQQRQKIEFALVHSVLAIGYRLRPGTEDTVLMGDNAAMPNPFAEDKSQQYLRDCGRLLHDLVTRDEDTLGIQALLAMVVLHLANGDEKLVSMLISAAMRLAHSLQLHTSASDVSFPLHEAQQRHNIFWICYCLDKDTSLRTITPSVQLDDDIDLGLPGTTSPCVCVSPENMFGIMEEEGRPPPPFHYLRARVQLAFIQGQIYDKLYSVRSLKETPEQRRQQVARLDALLDAWRRSSLPPAPAPAPAFHQEGAEDNHDSLAATLNHTHLFCLFTLHGLYSQDSVWVQNIDVLGRTALEDFSNKSGRCMHSLQPPIPDAWNKCVLASRCSVELITNKNNHEKRQNNSTNHNNIWSSTCLLFSALVILLVNITYEPGHPQAPHDRQLAADGAALFQQGLLLRRKGEGDEKSTNTLAGVLRGLELAADKWTDYYALDPLSVRPPLPAKGHDLFGNGILAMPAGSSSLDLIRDDEAASTEALMDAPVSFNNSMTLWTERTRLGTLSMDFQR